MGARKQAAGKAENEIWRETEKTRINYTNNTGLCTMRSFRINSLHLVLMKSRLLGKRNGSVLKVLGLETVIAMEGEWLWDKESGWRRSKSRSQSGALNKASH